MDVGSASSGSKGGNTSSVGAGPGKGTDTKGADTKGTDTKSADTKGVSTQQSVPQDKNVCTADIDKANSPQSVAEEADAKAKSDAFAEALGLNSPKADVAKAETEATEAVEAAKNATPEEQAAALADARSKVDGLKVASERAHNAAEGVTEHAPGSKSSSVAKGAQTPARMSTSSFHGLSAVLGTVDLVNNAQNMSLPQQVSTTSAIAADLASTISTIPGNNATNGILGAVNKYSGPMGLLGKTTEGVTNMVDGPTQADRIKGATMTAAGLGTLSTSGAAALAGMSKVAFASSGFGTAVISGVEGVTQLVTADTTQGRIAGGLKTGASLAFAAAAIPGPHSVPLAIAGAGMYAGGVVADNWDTVTEYGGKAIDAVSETAGNVANWAGDVASDAYEGVSSTVSDITNGIAGWFN